MTGGPIRLALIGCGAAAESLHLPAAANLPDEVHVHTLVDRDLDRARLLAKQFGVAHVCQEAKSIPGGTEGAIIATPNHLHVSMARQVLEMGLPILVEKPMARNSAECLEIMESSSKYGLPVAVGMIRRHTEMCDWIHQFLQADILGQLTQVVVDEGQIFDWPIRSASQFNPTISGGGVLMDIGVHVLDLLQHWLGRAQIEEYRDDAAGGVEAECNIKLRFPGGVPACVTLSRLRKLTDTIVFQGRGGVLRCTTMPVGDISFAPSGTTGTVLRARFNETFLAAAQSQLRDFSACVRNGGLPKSPAHQALEVVKLVEDCYAAKQPLMQPWMSIC